MILDLITKNRSYRRFDGNFAIDEKTLKHLVNLAHLSASGRNLQPLKYFISNTSAVNAKIYPTLAWAGYLTDWNGPEPDERPTAYIIMVVDKTLTNAKPQHDEGIACQSILLGAIEKNIGGCIIASIKRAELAKILNIPQQFEIELVIALGKPKEKVVITDVKNNNIKYYRDSAGTHYVPKRALNDIAFMLK